MSYVPCQPPNSAVSLLHIWTAAWLVSLCWFQVPVVYVSQSRYWSRYFYHPPSFYTPHLGWTTKPNPRSRKREALSLGPLPEQQTHTPLPSSREGGMTCKGPQPKLPEPQFSPELPLKMCPVIVLVLLLFCPCVEARFLP